MRYRPDGFSLLAQYIADLQTKYYHGKNRQQIPLQKFRPNNQSICRAREQRAQFEIEEEGPAAAFGEPDHIRLPSPQHHRRHRQSGKQHRKYQQQQRL